MSKQAKAATPEAVTTKSIHKQLQEIAARELATLPEYLEQLQPAERVRALLAILPYTAPKVETCPKHYGEPGGAWASLDD